jgi:hypothetical protein
MVRDVCQGGAGVALVIGRAGTGKTFALGIARHAWQLDGYRLLAAAPTGIATMSLQGEGFEDVATCDRLLGDLDRGREQLDARTVLVVDEAGMVGSRKLGRLLEHAQQAHAKVVLVGDDRQLAAIDAGGGFRALRLRLGASELVENRRQHQAWEREALDLIRSGLVEEAVAAYQAHDRVVAADSKPAATLALLRTVDGLAGGRTGPGPRGGGVGRPPGRGRPAQQPLPGAAGRPGPARRRAAAGRGPPAGGGGPGRVRQKRYRRAGGGQWQPRHHHRPRPPGSDRDDPAGRHRRPDGDPAPVVSGWPPPRRAEPAGGPGLCHHGHRAQGLTRGRALVRLTGTEDVNWLYVQLSRARQDTHLYAVVGPEPHGAGELDLPDREQPDGYLQLAQALSRAGGQSLAIDTPSSLNLQQLSMAELRAERDRPRHQLDQATRDRTRELQRATAHREQAEQALAAYRQPAGHRSAGMLRWLRRGDDQPAGMPGGLAVATQQANRAHDRERELRQHQHVRDGWLEANAHLGPQYRQVVRTLAWQRRATGLAVEQERPGYVLEALGPVPASTRGRRSWRQAAAEIQRYRHTYQVTDPDRALGPEPHDPGQRAARQQARMAIDRVQAKQRAADRPNDRQPTSERTNQPQPREQRGRQGPERAAG